MKPVRSTETSEPSSSRHRSPGVCAAQSSTSRGRYGSNGACRSAFIPPESTPSRSRSKGHPGPLKICANLLTSGRLVRMRNRLRIVVSFLATLIALTLPGFAQAHHDPPFVYQGARAATTPTINGSIGAGEWSDTPSYDVTFEGVPGTVRMKHDAEFLYVAMTATDDSSGDKSMGVLFDDNHDGIKDPGEDVMLGFASPFSFGADYYFSSAGSSGASHYSDAGDGGTNPPGGGSDNVVGAGQVVGPEVTFELRHPLCSEDTVHDFCLDPGDTVGLDFMYVIGGTGFMYPGADALVPNDWADLTVSAAPGPTGRIVFESNRDGQLEIYRMDADGSAPTRLTNDAAADNLPAISPDGTKVAFTSDREGSADIFVMDIDGGGVTRLTSDAGLELQPAWSPDGTKIAYTGSSIEQYDIFVVDAAGGPPVDVTNTAADEASASWSPDGTQLAFMSDRDGNEEVYRQNADGTGTATRLTNNPARDADPDWSPDGEKIAFFTDRPGSGCCGTVWTINASDGSGAANLTNGSIFDADPSWSPDGSQIAFVRDAGGQNFEVWTANADGTNQVNLTPIGGRNSFPDWGITASPISATISIDGPASSTPGAASAAIADIPLDAIRGETGTRGAAPLEGIPLAGIPLEGHPARAASRSGGIPLEGIGFTVENLNQNGLGGVPLSTIPLVPARHVGGAPRARPGLQGDASAERDAGTGARDSGRRRDQARGPDAGLEPTRRHPARGNRARLLAARGASPSRASRTRQGRRTWPTGASTLTSSPASTATTSASSPGRRCSGLRSRACRSRASRSRASRSRASRSRASRSRASRLARRSKESRSEGST